VTRQGPGFVGDDIVDLRSPLLTARAGRGEAARLEWEARHLTDRERASTGDPRTFWEIFAVKEASSKALAQAGVAVRPGAFRDFEVSLPQRRVTHLPTRLRARVALLETTADSIHAVVLYPASESGARLAAGVATLPENGDASEAARDLLAGLLAADRGARPGRFAVASREGRPEILDAGQWRDWSVSLSHAGRFVAACALLP
jgi:phosphopantetheinyl transferase (holo-ACP synthase)